MTAIKTRIPKDASFEAKAAYLGALINDGHLSNKRNNRTGKITVLLQFSKTKPGAEKEFKDIGRTFGLKSATITKSDHHRNRPQKERHLSVDFKDTDPQDVRRSINVSYEWLNDKALADDMIAACNEAISDAL